jgi:uncharacterized protein YggU (UPF0235/DUF167 family)
VARIRLWVKANRTTDSIDWDPWRKGWAVTCRASPVRGEANRAVAELMAHWLGVAPSEIRWARAGSSRSKTLVAGGITDEEADRRLRSLLPHL